MPLSNYNVTGQATGRKFQKFLKPPGPALILSRVNAAAPQTSQRAHAELEVAETVGRLMQFWGFKRVMGKLWTALYLSAEPITAAELGARLELSAGAVSMGLTELERWGCVQRTTRPGDRHDYFAAEADIWKMVRTVLSTRELALIREFGGSIDRAHLAAAGADRESAHVRARLESLRGLATTGEALLLALVRGSLVDPTPLARTPNPADEPES